MSQDGARSSAFGMQMFLPISWTLSGEISDGLFLGVGLKGLFGLAYSSFKSSGDITSYEDRLFGKGSVEHLYNFGDLYFQRDSLLSYSKMGKFEPNINGKGYAAEVLFHNTPTESLPLLYAAIFTAFQ